MYNRIPVMLLKYNVNFKFPSVPMKYTLFLFIIVVVSENLCKFMQIVRKIF